MRQLAIPPSQQKALHIENYIIRDIPAVIPAQAGIQQDKNAFRLNPLDSRLPPVFTRVTGNDVANSSSPNSIPDGVVLSSFM
ncbi:MAG: hypothetical protein HY935_00085 [Nitrosomonadales bacterium]|nr:hypothetical protein [Nitrosomonadales bacterium]